MSRRLTPGSSLDNLRREAKRWLKALRAGDAGARARFERSHPDAPSEPTLRDVQHALAREHEFSGWAELKREVQVLEAGRGGAREHAIQRLLGSAARGDTAEVIAVLAEWPDIVNERALLQGHDGLRTALHHAGSRVDTVAALLERGADPDIRDEGDDATPLHFAAERGDMGVVRLLIEHGADPVGEGTHHELNALGWAVCWDYTHQQEVAEYLLAHGARHTIHTAVALGAVESIREIAARSPADLNAPMDRTNLRRRPLHLAVIKKRADSLATLLDLGADMAATDAAGMTPLDQAATDGEADMVGLLLEHGAAMTLPAAIALERTADVERLLRERPDDLKPGGRYGTLIVRAAARAPGHVVRAFIRAGADVNVGDDPDTSIDQAERFTALHAAAFAGNREAVEVLLEHGADPNVREGKWCSPPAGWAAYAGHAEVRDIIVAARIDLFQAIDFDRADRIAEIVQQSPWLLTKRFGNKVTHEPQPDQWWPEPWHTPLAWAVVSRKPAAVRALLEQGAPQISSPDGRSLLAIAREAGQNEIVELLDRYRRIEATHEGRVRWFVKNACPDHDIRGPRAHAMARNTAARLLRRHPEIARDSLYTAVVCGDLDAVARALAERPEAANERGGPKGWTPLLYLCFTRLPSVAAASDNAIAIARLLLDHGSDPNAYFMAGDSRYTPLVGAIGEGEEDRPAHPRRDELVRLLLQRGAEPYDIQVLYNIHFHGDVLWFLELVHDRSLELGRGADWQDAEWPMLNMGGYGMGARYLLEIAVRRNDVALTEWLLAHGATPDPAPAPHPGMPRRSVYEEALRLGHDAVAGTLARYGARTADVRVTGEDAFAAAALAGDFERARALAAAHPEYLRSSRAIMKAAERDRADIVAFLLDLGVPIEIENEQKQRPLHAAAWRNALRAAELLIARGAQIDPRESEWGNSPLDFAVYGQHEPMIELLARYSDDIWNLVFTGHVERVRAVLSRRPELAHVTTSAGRTPLTWLPDDERAAVELVRLFLEHGADPSQRDENGLTAADHASRRGLEEAAAVLRVAEAHVPERDPSAQS